MNWREFRLKRPDGKVKVWRIRHSSQNEYTVEWGFLDGKRQTTSDLVPAVGKEGTKAFKTPEEQCKLTIQRLIKKKQEEGYVEYDEEGNVIQQKNGQAVKLAQEISFQEPLGKNVTFHKPQNTLPTNKIKLLREKQALIVTRKRNGMMHVLVKDASGEVSIYSRRMDLLTKHFPHIVIEAAASQSIPKKSILLGEIVADPQEDDFKRVSEVVRCLPQEAILRQARNGVLHFIAFDVAFWNGKNLLEQKPFGRRLENIRALGGHKYIHPVEEVQTTLETTDSSLMQLAIDRGWEGFVVYDSKQISKKPCIRFDGKAERASFAWKLKPVFEDDFIAKYDPDNGLGARGRGKNRNKFGKAALFKIDKDGNHRYICDCGGGFSDEQREFYNNPKLFPRVWQIKYSDKTESGALVFPVFVRDRTTAGDKTIDECTD